MLNCLNLSDKLEICNIVLSAILSVVLIMVTIIISIKQNKIQKEISERDVKISFMKYRLEFFNELISTVMYLQTNLDVLKSRKNKDYYIEYLDKIYEKEKGLMQVCNSASFLFPNNEKIQHIAKEIYKNFSDYRVTYTDIALNLDTIEKEYCNYLKNTNAEKKYQKKSKDADVFNQYFNKRYPMYIKYQLEILEIVKKPEFDEIFKPYFEIKGSFWEENLCQKEKQQKNKRKSRKLI